MEEILKNFNVFISVNIIYSYKFSTTKSAQKKNGNVKGILSQLHRCPSQNTLNRLDRETYVLYKRPIWTIFYCILEIFCMTRDFLKRFLLNLNYAVIF